ncbi:hypothetical protein KC19_1G148000 [Ceratodon purpureus]|uniref:F-box domain-containing protein n=1 Tax=Ceratodon purpureus TaxID=3225 RepID=A0A8T0J8K6_CERPU|nr:hypothetical protein KC19_1G148000 [Ceratodon purpureus]
MESNQSVLGNLPLEIMEVALSFLSVPELCRMRAVCKSWNEIINRPSFHDLCDVNGRNDEYLFLWSEGFCSLETRRIMARSLLSGTLSFLDVDAKRFYTILGADPPRICRHGHEVESRFIAMNYGLVCELTTVEDSGDNKFNLTMCYPVAKTREMLPTTPKVSVLLYNQLVSSLTVTAVNGAIRSYEAFSSLNNLSHTRAPRAHPRMYLHEQSTDERRAVRVPDGVVEEQEEDLADQGVVTQEFIFVVKQRRHNERTRILYSGTKSRKKHGHKHTP